MSVLADHKIFSQTRAHPPKKGLDIACYLASIFSNYQLILNLEVSLIFYLPFVGLRKTCVSKVEVQKNVFYDHRDEKLYNLIKIKFEYLYMWCS